MMKKGRILLLALCLTLLCLSGALAETQSGSCGDSVNWTLDENGLLTISGSGPMADYTSISSPFSNAGVVTAVIENGVTSIGEYAFYGCTSLTSVTIPASVTRISDYAFRGCSSLTSVTIPYGVTSIEKAFSYCSSLTSITIPDSVTSISDFAFTHCHSLNDIQVSPDNPNYCDQDGILFNKNKSSLQQYPAGKTDVTYEIPQGVTTIGVGALGTCARLISVTIPNSVTTIGDRSFFLCSGLTSVTLPDSVTIIGEAAFINCTSLTSITIPDSVTSIGLAAFMRCSSLTGIQVSPDNPNYCDQDGILFNKNKSILLQYPAGKTDEAYEIPHGITSIGESAFENCTNLTSVSIPDSVTSIADYAFYNCASLTSVTIPDSVTSIGGYAFYDCTSLTGITIPDSVTSIGSSAFYGCDNLSIFCYKGTYAHTYAAENGIPYTLLTDPPAPAIIDSGSCGDSVNWTLDENGVLTISGQGDMDDYYNTYYFGEYPWGKNITQVIIEEGVTGIGIFAFGGQRNLTSVTIPSTVSIIKEWAFSYCGSLTGITVADNNPYYKSVNGVLFNKSMTELILYPSQCESSVLEIPDTVVKIMDNAIYSCNHLTNVIIPEGVNTIGQYNFAFCGNLTEVTLPSSVSYLGTFVFGKAENLQRINVASGNPHFSSNDGVLFNAEGTVLIQFPFARRNDYTIPSGTEKVGDYAFSGVQLSGVTFPDGLASIGNHAFQNCSGLTEIVIPDSVTSIGDYAFQGCTGLTSVTIPASVTSIGNSVLSGADNAVIQCFEGSAAQAYAFENDIPYALIAALQISIDKETRMLTVTSYDDHIYEIDVSGPESHHLGLSSSVKSVSRYLSTDGIYTVEAVDVTENKSAGSISFILGTVEDQLSCVFLPAALITIEEEAFAGAAFEAVIIPDGCIAIGSRAFADCPNLQYVRIPASVTSIADDAFEGCGQIVIDRVE